VRQEGGIVLIDAGMAFPDEEMPGIDLVLPDFSYLRDHRNELTGIVLTHGHEDHVGALPYLLREFEDVPVYGTRLTLGLVRPKLAEFGIKRADLREVKAGDNIDPGRGSLSAEDSRGLSGLLRRLQDRPDADRGRADGPISLRGPG
jgi:ribonuclease J